MVARLAVALLLFAACDGTPLPSDGSRFETARSWATQLTVDGHARPEWVVRDGDVASTMDQLRDLWARAGVQIRPRPLVQRTDEAFVRYERLLLDSALGSNSPELAGLLALSSLVVDAQDTERPLVLFLVADII